MSFAMYSSNWTQMDMKFKRLFLLAMKMQNANGLNMKITNKLTIDLELCARVSATHIPTFAIDRGRNTYSNIVKVNVLSTIFTTKNYNY